MHHILLVDADLLSLRILDVSLRKAGFSVSTTTEGPEALALFRARRPDLVVIAARLREADGLGLARSLRDEPQGRDVPVIAVTDAESALDRERARDAGVEDVVVRPIFVRELIARARLAIARSARRAVTAETATGDGAPRAGTTDDVALADLLRALEASTTTGVVHVSREGGQEARIHLREGNVVDAELERLRGAEVVYRALTWEAASFRVVPGPVDNEDLIECSTRELLLQAMDRIDGRTRPAPAAVTVVAGAEAAPAVGAVASSESPASESKVTSGASQTESMSAREPASPPGAASDVAAASAEPAPMEPVAAGVERERSSPSTAPWTRETTSSEAPPPDADLVVAGVPRGRARGRIAVLAAAAALLVAVGLHSMRSGHGNEVAAASGLHGGPGSESPAVVGAKPPSPVHEGAAAPQAPASVTPDLAPDLASASAAPSDVPPTAADPAVGALAAASASAAPVDAHEKALGLRADIHARSPLVRDAEAALLKGDASKALSLAQQAVAANSADADAWLTLAAARKANGDMGGARDAYTKCIANAHTFGVMSCRALAAKSE